MSFPGIYKHYGRKVPWGFYQFDSDVESVFLKYKFLFGEHWLDVGCGYSPWLDYVQKNNIQYMGIDIAESVLLENRMRFPDKSINFILGDVSEMDFQSDSFSFIIDLGCLHCIPMDFHEDILFKYMHYLQTGGYMLIRFFQSNNGTTPLFFVDDTPIWGVDRSKLFDYLGRMFIIVEECRDSDQFDIADRILLLLKKV